MWRGILTSRLWVSAGVVVILAAALIGGSVFVQKRGEQVRAHNAEVAVQQQNSQKSDGSHDTSTNNTNTNTNANNQPSSSDQAGQSTGEPASSGSTDSQLPQTGPGDVVGTALVLALLTFTAVSYVSSRRLVAGL